MVIWATEKVCVVERVKNTIRAPYMLVTNPVAQIRPVSPGSPIIFIAGLRYCPSIVINPNSDSIFTMMLMGIRIFKSVRVVCTEECSISCISLKSDVLLPFMVFFFFLMIYGVVVVIFFLEIIGLLRCAFFVFFLL